MTSKGENKRAKSRSMPKQIPVSKKEHYWTIRARSGPHNKATSMPLGLVLRNFVQVASTLKEIKKILNNGQVKVNGVVRKSHQFPAGLFDVIAIDAQKLYYRIILDKKERLFLKQIEKESKEKVVKVNAKKMTKKGVQLTTNDGKNYFKVNANVGDSLRVSLPEGKVLEVIELGKGSIAYITKGANCSKTAVVEEVVEGTARRRKLVKFTIGKENFETVVENIFLIGKGKTKLEDLE